MDSNPAAAAVAGDSVVRAAARTLDVAAFGSNAGNSAIQPAGLLNLDGVRQLSWVTYTDMDWAIEAEAMLNQVGAAATNQPRRQRQLADAWLRGSSAAKYLRDNRIGTHSGADLTWH